jgi:hypothetical protein
VACEELQLRGKLLASYPLHTRGMKAFPLSILSTLASPATFSREHLAKAGCLSALRSLAKRTAFFVMTGLVLCGVIDLEAVSD